MKTKVGIKSQRARKKKIGESLEERNKIILHLVMDRTVLGFLLNSMSDNWRVPPERHTIAGLNVVHVRK